MKTFPFGDKAGDWLHLDSDGNCQLYRLENRVDNGLYRFGAMIHVNLYSAVWIQESYGKVVTAPRYATSSIG